MDLDIHNSVRPGGFHRYSLFRTRDVESHRIVVVHPSGREIGGRKTVVGTL